MTAVQNQKISLSLSPRSLNDEKNSTRADTTPATTRAVILRETNRLRFDSASISVGDFRNLATLQCCKRHSVERRSDCENTHPKRQNGRDAVRAFVLFLAHKSEADVSPVFVPDYRDGGGRARLAVFDGRVSECSFPFVLSSSHTSPYLFSPVSLY